MMCYNTNKGCSTFPCNFCSAGAYNVPYFEIRNIFLHCATDSKCYCKKNLDYP